jgi:hypothetical protein
MSVVFHTRVTLSLSLHIFLCLQALRAGRRRCADVCEGGGKGKCFFLLSPAFGQSLLLLTFKPYIYSLPQVLTPGKPHPNNREYVAVVDEGGYAVVLRFSLGCEDRFQGEIRGSRVIIPTAGDDLLFGLYAQHLGRATMGVLYRRQVGLREAAEAVRALWYEYFCHRS